MTTPTETPPTTDPIRDAFEAILWFLECVLGTIRTSRLEKLTPAEDIGALAACEVEADFEPDEPPTALIKLRDIIQRAAEEHARRTEPQNASLEERVLTPGERAAFLAGVSAADEDREFDEHRTCATPTDDPPLTEADLRAAEERWHAFRVAIETITTEEGEDPAEELFESARDLVHGDIAEEHEDMIDSHRARVNALRGAFLDARTDLPRALREIRRQRATVDAAAKHLGCEPHVLVLCASSRMAEIERLTAILREARRRLAPLPRALTPEDHEPDTLPARIDAVLGGKDH